MFTGIIEAVGQVARAEPQGGDVRLTVSAGGLDLADVAIGDSIACNGVCLTVTERLPDAFCVDVSAETLRCTVGFAAGAQVNLEKAMQLGDRLGGHLVSGHVDGVGQVVRFVPVGECMELVVRAPAALARYLDPARPVARRAPQ